MNEYLAEHLPTDKIVEYCARQPILRLSVFGSAAKEDLRPESDIDLLVEYLPDAGVGLFDMGGHLVDLTEIIGRKVDLVTKKGLCKYIRDEVLETARIIYAKES